MARFYFYLLFRIITIVVTVAITDNVHIPIIMYGIAFSPPNGGSIVIADAYVLSLSVGYVPAL